MDFPDGASNEWNYFNIDKNISFLEIPQEI